MKCTKCGKEVEEGMVFCDGCGERLAENRDTEKKVVYTEREQRLLELLKVRFGAPITL